MWDVKKKIEFAYCQDSAERLHDAGGVLFSKPSSQGTFP